MKADLNQYQRLAARTLPSKFRRVGHGPRGLEGSTCPAWVDPEREGCVGSALLIHGALKLTGEAGEVADLVGKWYGQGHEIDDDELIDELGDVLWHLAELCTALGVDVGVVAYRNLEKLRRRYPDGFEEVRSLNRAEQHSAFVEALDESSPGD